MNYLKPSLPMLAGALALVTIGCGAPVASVPITAPATTQPANPGLTTAPTSALTSSPTLTATSSQTAANTPIPTTTALPTNTSAPTSVPPTATTRPTVPPALPQAFAVIISVFKFKPDPVKISAGTKVIWTNSDDLTHTVTSGINGEPTGVFDSGPFTGGQTYSFTFSQPGQYPYYCKVHPFMIGEITVTP